MENRTIEQQVADAILQKATNSIRIGDITYEVAPPTPATLIMVSGLVSQMPEIDGKTENILRETLRFAKDSEVIGEIAATLIIGAKRIRENRTVETGIRRRWSWRRFRFVKESETMPEIDYVTRAILEEVAPATLASVISKRFLDMQIADFFGLTTSLSGINILKPTKEVEQTASGEPSSAGQKR